MDGVKVLRDFVSVITAACNLERGRAGRAAL